MSEQWRKVPDWPYEVSSMGRVRRATPGKRTRAGRILRPMTRAGYHRVCLRDMGRTKWCVVHRLVAEAFLGSPPRGRDQVNHRNGDKADNRVPNLEWVSCAENVAHASDNGLRDNRGEAHTLSKLTRADVVEIRAAAGGDVTQRELAGRYGVSEGLISNVVHRRAWRHVA